MTASRSVVAFMVGTAIMVLSLAPNLCNALVIYPGEFKDQIRTESGSTSRSAVGIGRLNSGHVPALIIARSEAEVDLANGRIKLSAWAQSCDTPTDVISTGCRIGNYRAASTGRLNVSICIPLAGKTTCDPGDEGPAVATTIAFDAARVGYIVTFSPAAKGTMSLTADIVDTSTSRSAAYQEIASETQGSLVGSVHLVKIVPVPIPELGSSDVTTRTQFVALLRRGHNYRFQLRANVTATGGLGVAHVNFRDALVGIPAFNGYFELYNLAIDVSPDTSGGIDPKLIQDLQQHLAELGDRVDAVLARLADDEAQNSAELQTLATQLDQLGPKLQTLSTQVDALNQNQANLSRAVQSLNRRVNALAEQVEKMRGRDRRDRDGEREGHERKPGD